VVESPQLASDVQRLGGNLSQLPEPTVKPVLVAVSGLPGTGKSYFCGKLAERLPFAILESDALRKSLFRSPDYSPKESARLFRAIQHLIEGLLRKGISILVDATNLSEKHREYLYSITGRLGIKLVLVNVEAPPDVVRQRLERRLEEPDRKSDADWAIYQKLRPSVQKIRRKHYVVDTSRDITPALDKIVREVMR
jgi:predicted kinase